MNSQIIGKTIQKCRKERHLSQEVLSGLADVDRSHLSKIELGIRSPTVSVFYKLASAMGMTGSQLLALAEAAEDKERPPR